MTTIAIPRVADSHYYHLLWKYFFENLGLEVILSPETTKSMVDAGVKAANTDLCFAMKVYYGHVLKLMKQKFDILFVPSTIGSHKKGGGDYCCAYFAALPSMIKSSFDVRILSETLYTDSDDYGPAVRLARKLRIFDEKKVKQAFDKAFERWKQEKKKIKNKRAKRLHKPAKRIALVGPDYIILDRFCDMNIPKMLEQENIEVVYSSDLIDGEIGEKDKIKEGIKRFPDHIHWHVEKELLGALYHFIEDKAIDGIILLYPFSCGPCFLLKEQVVSRNLDKKKFLVLNIDESQNEARIRTRIEAFLDIIRQ